MFSWFYVRDRLDITSTEKPVATIPIKKLPIVLKKYVSNQYGFSFSYPDTFNLEEYNPDQITIGREGIIQTTHIVDVSILKSSTDIQIQSFDEFVLDTARDACSYKTNATVVTCTRIDDVVNIKPFTSDSGAQGQVFYLKGSERNSKTGKSAIIRRGPFYTFNTTASTPNSMSFIMIHNPVQLDPSAADLQTIEVVAKSYEGGR